MSEYCERCVHTDAEIARLTKELDDLRAELERKDTRLQWLESVVAAAKQLHGHLRITYERVSPEISPTRVLLNAMDALFAKEPPCQTA